MPTSFLSLPTSRNQPHQDNRLIRWLTLAIMLLFGFGAGLLSGNQAFYWNAVDPHIRAMTFVRTADVESADTGTDTLVRRFYQCVRGEAKLILRQNPPSLLTSALVLIGSDGYGSEIAQKAYKICFPYHTSDSDIYPEMPPLQ